MKNIKALIVAAGRGSRLGSITTETPKPLVKVNGEPLLKRSIEILSSFGVDDITVVVGYKAELIKNSLPKNIKYVTNPEYEYTNNLMSMYYVSKNLIGSNFLYLHSDIWYDPRIIKKVLKQRDNITFMVDQKLCQEEEMKLKIKNNIVAEADKNIPPSESLGEWLGITKFSIEGGISYINEIKLVASPNNNSYDCSVVKNLFLKGIDVNWSGVGKYPWIEIDFIEDLKEAEKLSRKNIL